MIRVRQVKLLIEEDNTDNLINKVCKKIRVNLNDIRDYKIVKKSIDARDKTNIYYVYEVDVELVNQNKVKIGGDILITPKEEYSYEITGKEELNNRIVIVGAGPSGLMCSYMLAEAGYNPLSSYLLLLLQEYPHS